jgi:hypothetical protein
MKRYILLFAVAAALFLTACCGNSQSSKQPDETPAADELVESSIVNEEGVKLDMSFNHAKGIARVTLKGEVIELVTQKPASGMWYKNDHYELRGKGGAIELRKDGQVVFAAP